MAFWQPAYSRLIKIPNATLQFWVYNQFVSLQHANTDDPTALYLYFFFLVYFLICNVNLVHKSPDVCVCSDTCSVPGLRHRLLQHHDERHEETWLRHRTGRRRCRRQHTVRHVCLVHRGAAVQNVAKTPGSPKQEIMCKTIFLRPLTNEKKKNQPGTAGFGNE